MRIILSLIALMFISLPALAQDQMEVWSPYLAKIEKDIKASWYDISGFKRHKSECRTTLFFSVKKSGELGTITILSSTCNKALQDNALSAVKKTAPFAPFPKEITGIDEININYNFDCKLLPENKLPDSSKNTVSAPVSQSLDTLKNIKTDTPQKTDVKQQSKNNIQKYIIPAGILISVIALLVILIFTIKRKQKISK